MTSFSINTINSVATSFRLTANYHTPNQNLYWLKFLGYSKGCKNLFVPKIIDPDDVVSRYAIYRSHKKLVIDLERRPIERDSRISHSGSPAVHWVNSDRFSSVVTKAYISLPSIINLADRNLTDQRVCYTQTREISV